MNENALNTFYNNIVKSDTTFSADYDTFKNGMQDANVRKELYKRLRESNSNFPSNDYDVDAVLGFQTKFDNAASKATNKAVSELRNDKYASLTDDELDNQWNNMLSKGEQKKSERIASAKNEMERFEREHPFLNAIGKIQDQGVSKLPSQSITPIEAIESQHASQFLDESDLEEFKALDKERGVRGHESGHAGIRETTMNAQNIVEDIRDKASRDDKPLSGWDKVDLNMAERINTKAQELVDAPSKYGEEAGVSNWWQGLSDTLFDRDIISVVGMVRDMNVSHVVQKLNDGKELSDSENALIVAVANFDEVQERRSSDLSVGYQIGQGTAQCVPLIIDMMITKGLGAAGKSALIKNLDKLVKAGKMSQKSLDRFARVLNGAKGVSYTSGKKDNAVRVTVGALEDGAKKTFGQYAGDVARELIETGIQTYAMPSSQRQMIQEKTDLRRKTGENDIAFKDRARIFGNAYTQTFTERAGGKAIDWTLGKVFGMTNVLQKFGFDRGILKLLNDAVQNPISEIGEEYLGAIINLVRSTDLFDLYSEQSNEELRDDAMSMFTSEGFWQTVGTTLPMSLFGGAANYSAIKAETRKYNKSNLELSQYLQNTGMTKSQAENILRQIEGAKDSNEFKERMSILKTYLTNYIMENNNDTGIAKGKLEGMNTLLDTYSQNIESYEEAIGGLKYALSSMSKEDKEKVAIDFKTLVDKANKSITATPQTDGKDITPANKQSAGWAKRKYTVTIDGKKENITVQGELFFNEDGSINSTQTEMGKVHIQNEQGKNIRTTVKADKKKEIFDKYLDAINDELRKQKAQKDAETLATQKAEEARKAELARIKAEEKAKLENENAKLEAEKGAIAQLEAEKQTILGSLPKDKQGEVSEKDMKPEQKVLYWQQEDTPETVVKNLTDQLVWEEQQISSIQGKDMSPADKVSAIRKHKNSIKAYEQAITKWLGQETLDAINAARVQALQNTPPVQGEAPAAPAEQAPVVEPAQDETPADSPTGPDTTPLPLPGATVDEAGTEGEQEGNGETPVPDTLGKEGGVEGNEEGEEPAPAADKPTANLDEVTVWVAKNYDYIVTDKEGNTIFSSKPTRKKVTDAFEELHQVEGKVDGKRGTYNGEDCIIVRDNPAKGYVNIVTPHGIERVGREEVMIDGKPLKGKASVVEWRENNEKKYDTFESIMNFPVFDIRGEMNITFLDFLNTQQDSPYVAFYEMLRKHYREKYNDDVAQQYLDASVARLIENLKEVARLWNIVRAKRLISSGQMPTTLERKKMDSQSKRMKEAVAAVHNAVGLDNSIDFSGLAELSEKAAKKAKKKGEGEGYFAETDEEKAESYVDGLVSNILWVGFESENKHEHEDAVEGIVEALNKESKKASKQRELVVNILNDRLEEAKRFNRLNDIQAIERVIDRLSTLKKMKPLLTEAGLIEEKGKKNTPAKPAPKKDTSALKKQLSIEENSLRDLEEDYKRETDEAEKSELEGYIAQAKEKIAKLKAEIDGAEFMVGNRERKNVSGEARELAFAAVTRALDNAGIKWQAVSLEEALRVARENGKAELLQTTNSTVYGYVLDGVIYLAPDGMNAETAVHEYIHLWVRAMRKHNPNAWRSILSLLRKNEDLFNKVKVEMGYDPARHNENDVASEMIARYTEDAGLLYREAQEVVGFNKSMESAIKINSIVNRIRMALNDFWNWVGKTLFDIPSFNSMDEVANQVLYDLFNETNLVNPNKSSTFAANKNIVPASELAVAYEDLFARQQRGQFSNGYGYSYSANFFHISIDGKIVKSIQIEGNENEIKLIKERYETNESTGTFIGRSSNGRGSSGTNNTNDDSSKGRRRRNDGVDGLHEERESNGSRYNQEVSRDSNERAAEREQIVAEAKANGTYMMHNGQPTNLTEDQWVTVRTQDFKDYFGDWINDKDNASVVLDENGEPLVVYHGSRMAGFDKFGRGEARDSQGIYTTPNRRAAESYATSVEEWRSGQTMPEAELGVPDHHGVYSLFVNMRNPKVIDFGGKEFDRFGTPKYEVATNEALNYGERGILFDTLEEAEAYIADHPEEDLDYVEKYTTSDELLVQAKEEGYDGVIFTNIIDSRYPDPITNYVPFEPNQVKSATQNVGTFNPEDDRIEFMIGPAAVNETEEKIKKASEDVESAFVTADVPLPDKTNALAKLATAVCDSGEAFRQFMKALRKYRKKNHLGKLPEGRDIRQIYDNQRVVLKNKVTELLNLYETPLLETLDKLIKVVENSSMYQKYQEDKVVYTIEEEDADGKITTKTWTDYVEITPREFIERYLIACDSVERLNNGIPPRGLREFYSRMGVNVYDFQMEFEAAFASDGEGEALVKELWKRINAYTNYTLEDSYECGMLTEEEYNKRKARKFYVPERDFQAEKELEQTEIKPQKHYRSNKLASSKQAKGGNSLAANIIENMIHIGNIDLSKNNKNRVKLAMFNLLKENEDFRRSIGLPKPEEVWYDSDGKRVSNKPSKTLIERIKWLESQIAEYDSLIAIEESQAVPDTVEIAQLEKEMQDLIDERNSIPYMLEYDARDKFFGENNPHMVGVYVDGVLCSMQFPNMSLIATALNDTWADSLAVRDVLKRISGYMCSIITSYEPSFFAVNTVTDSIAILTKGYVELGTEYAARFIATTKDLGKHMSLITAYMTGKDYRSMENGDLFRDFLMNGGNTGYATIRNMEEILRELQVLDNNSNHIKDGVKWIKKALSFTNESAELLLRFAAYKSAIDCGYGIEKATWAANNLSANFNRTGKKFNDTKFGWRALGEAMEWFRSLSMFTNPAIQGAMSYLRMFGDSGELNTKERVAKYFRLFNAAMFMPALCGFLNAMMFDDDEKEEWAASEYDRANYLVLGKRGKWAVTHMFRPFYNIGVNIAMGMQGRRTGGDIADSIITSFLTHLTPLPPVLTETASKGIHSLFGNADFTFFDGIESLVTPQGINALKELADGENFLGYKIRYEGSTAQYTKNPNAGAFEKIIAEQFYICGGGIKGSDSKITDNKNTIGRFWDVSPNEVKSVMQLFLPKSVIDVANITAGAVSEEHDVRLKDIPIVNRFTSDRTKEAYRAGIYSEANKIIKANDQIATSANGDIERLKIDLGKASSEEERVRIQREIDFYEGIYKQAKGDVFAVTIDKNLEKYKRIRMASLHKKYHHDEKSFKELYPDLRYDVIEDAERMFTFNMFQLICMYNGTGKVNDNLPNWMKDVFRMKPSTQEVNKMWEHYQKLQEENNERLGISEQ